MAQIITIVLADGAELPTVYIGSIDPLLAYSACWKAAEALEEKIEFAINQTTSEWTSP